MKVGDLVKPKQKYSHNEIGIGLIVKVEEGFYGKSFNGYLDDRLTIHWAHGETTREPSTYVELLK